METLAVILPIIAGGSVVIITGLSLYFKIRHKFPIRVNCWFCNQNTDVPFGNRDCWDCPKCEQYNGFLADGSYNKAIPAQHDELLNHPVPAVSSTMLNKKPSSEAKTNGLCRKCNINQELKVQQLAAFTPLNPAHFDEEVDEYRHHLERAYRLCSPCEEVLKQTLIKQKSMLLGFQLKELQNNSLFSRNGFYALKTKLWKFLPSWIDVIRYMTTMLAAWFVLATSFQLNKGQLPFLSETLNSTVWSFVPYVVQLSPDIDELLPLTLTYEIPFTAVGIAAQLAATLPKKHERIDIICVFFWILLHIQSWLRLWKKLDQYILPVDFNITYVAVAFFTLFVCTCGALVPRRRCTTVKTYNILKKPGNFSSSAEPSFNISNGSDDNLMNSPLDCEKMPAASVNGDLSPIGNHLEEENEPLPAFRNNVREFYPVTVSPSPDANSSPHVENSGFGVDKSEELGRGIGKLHLSSSSYEKWISKTNKVPSFETKIYGQNNSVNLFGVNTCNNLRDRTNPIIRPSQLNLCKNITQSSWVAGGYWQSPQRNRSRSVFGNDAQDMPSALTTFGPLSRSSSQSSGFVSQSSQPGIYDGVATSLPNSRTGSMCGGEFDRFSALSEPIYPYITTPVYYTGSKPGPFFGAPCYGGPPVFMHHAYSMIPQPRGFLPSPYGSVLPSQSQPILNQAQYYYPPQPPQPLRPIWNPSAFKPIPIKNYNTSKPAADVLSQSSSENSNESRSSMSSTSSSKTKTVPTLKRRTVFSVVKENLFLATLFCGSLLFNALILGWAMLANSNVMIPRLF